MLIAMTACQLEAQTPGPKLVPTAETAKKIRELQAKTDPLPTTTEDWDAQMERREGYFVQLRDLVTDFILRQLEAEPKIEFYPLRRQIEAIFGPAYNGKGVKTL